MKKLGDIEKNDATITNKEDGRLQRKSVSKQPEMELAT